jgi:hypothetical protein
MNAAHLVGMVFDAIGEPSVLGFHDCCQFTARWADAIGGTNLSAGVLAKYSTWPEALRFAHDHKADAMLRDAGWVDAEGDPVVGDVWIADEVVQVPYLYVGRDRFAVVVYPGGLVIAPAESVGEPVIAKLRHSTWVP